MGIKNWSDFYKEVKIMRSLQKEYFRIRSNHNLFLAKEQEKLIDSFITCFEDRRVCKTQKELF